MKVGQARKQYSSKFGRVRHVKAVDERSSNGPALTAVILAGLAALIAPAAYLIGYDYYDGYMSGFGVQAERFPLSTPAVYVHAFHTVGLLVMSIGEAAGKAYNALLSPPLVNVVIGVLCSAVIGIYLALKASRIGLVTYSTATGRGIRRRVTAWLKNNDVVKSTLLVLFLFYVAIIALLSAMSVALLWWVLPLSAYKTGQNDAKEMIEAYRSHNCHANAKSRWNNCITVVDQDGKPGYEGILVTMSDDLVVLFQKNSTYIFKREDGFVIRRELH